jgi:Fe-Mn family superoxide dismutase
LHIQPSPPFKVSEGIPGFLEPRSLDLHFNKIHFKATQKFNQLTANEATAFHFGLSPEVIMRLTADDRLQAQTFNATADYWNHIFFWHCLYPGGPRDPATVISPELEAWLKIHFGSSQRMMDRFSDLALNSVGSGWVWLVADNHQLHLLHTPNSGCPVALGPAVYPLLCLDMWEHSFALDYGHSMTSRAQYIRNFWSVVNWRFVEENLSLAIGDSAVLEGSSNPLDDSTLFFSRLR